MKRLLLIFVPLIIAACDKPPPVKRLLNECWYEAIKVYPTQPFMSEKPLNLVPMCMLARGYRFSITANCDLSSSMLNAMNEGCYRVEN